MDSSLLVFIRIMLFYIVLSYLVTPTIFYFMFGKSLLSAGNGFVVGSILSIILWYTYGSTMI
jgi:hypothetical protein